MYRRNPNIIYNEKLEKHLNNGFRMALVSGFETIIAVKRYPWELQLLQKSHKGSKIVEIKSLLREIN